MLRSEIRFFIACISPREFTFELRIRAGSFWVPRRCFFPFGFGWQLFARPRCISLCVIERHTDHRRIRKFRKVISVPDRIRRNSMIRRFAKFGVLFIRDFKFINVVIITQINFIHRSFVGLAIRRTHQKCSCFDQPHFAFVINFFWQIRRRRNRRSCAALPRNQSYFITFFSGDFAFYFFTFLR